MCLRQRNQNLFSHPFGHLKWLHFLRRYGNRHLFCQFLLRSRHLDLQGILIIKRCDDNVRNILLRHFFHPYCLPDSTLRRIKHTSALQLLFAPTIIRSITVILHHHQQLIRCIRQSLRHIYRKRQISSQMSFQKLSIHIHDRILVYRTKMQQPPFSFCQLHLPGQCPMIPKIFCRLQLSVHSRKICFWRKRHQNCAIIYLWFGSFSGNSIVPTPVQIHITVSFHPWPWIFL